MALDTATKRKAVTGIHLYPAGPGVTPDVAKGAIWRAQAGYGYSFEAVGVVFVPRIMMI